MKKLALFFSLAFLLFPAAAFGMAVNYSDPPGYPAPWPDAIWMNYTYQGTAVIDQNGGQDQSTGGTTPQQAADVGDGTSPSTYVYGDGTNLYFRFRLNGNPLQLNGNNVPYSSISWTVLLDLDGSGYKKFAVQLDGQDKSSLAPEDIVVYYSSTKSQDLSSATVLWRQDSARNPDNPNDVDGEVGGPSDWNTSTTPGVWDFGRTRVIQLGNNEYFLDIQVPLAALDASAYGGPALTANSWFAYGFATANSNANPAQKDFVYAGCYNTGNTANPLPFGDSVSASGLITQKPVIQTAPSSTSCSSSVTLSVNVLDADTANNCSTVATTVQSVKFYYYKDSNGNGLADDGHIWHYIGDAASTNGLSPWTLAWNPTGLSQGKYLVKAVAADNQGNVSDSYDTSSSSPTYDPGTSGASPVVASFNDTCGIPGVLVDGYVFNDQNSNGVKDPNEGGLGTPMYVKQCDVLSGKVINVAQADPLTGYYELDGLTSGAWNLVESANSAVTNCTPSDPPLWASTTPNTMNITVAGMDIANQDFGDSYGYNVSGYVFNDSNHDMVKETWETGLNATAYLKLCDQSGNVQKVVQADPATGYYQFQNVLNGAYTVNQSADNLTTSCTPSTPAGWLQTTPDTLNINVSNASLAGNAFGDFHGMIVKGAVFEDKGDGSAGSPAANNALLDTGEQGIYNGTVKACTTSSCASVAASSGTDSYGQYTLWIPAGSLPDGTPVFITAAEPSGYKSTGSSIGASIQKNTTVPDAERNITAYTMASGQVFSGFNFGFVKALAIAPDQSYLVSLGDSLTIRHIINLKTPGTAAVMLSSSNAWTYSVFNNPLCDGSTLSAPIAPNGGYFTLNGGAPLPAGATCIVIKTVVPTNTPLNTVEVLKVMLYENWNNSADTQSNPDPETGTVYDDLAIASDTISVNPQGSGTLLLTKSVRNVTAGESFTYLDSAKPCDILEYRIDYKNMGAKPLNSITFSDLIPAGTTFLNGQYSSSTKDIEFNCQGTTYYGGISDVPDTDGVTLANGTLSVNFGTLTSRAVLNPGESGYLKFSVQVQCR